MRKYIVATTSLILVVVLFSLFIRTGPRQTSQPSSIPSIQPDVSSSLEIQTLRAIITDCEHACFEGIELNTSTKTDVSNIFEIQGIEPVIDDYENSAIWSWKAEEGQFFNGYSILQPGMGFITVHGEIVRQVVVTFDAVDLATVIQAFGAPNAVIEQKSSSGSGILSFDFVYTDQGLIFSTDSRSSFQDIKGVILVSTELEDNQLNALLAINRPQSCTDYGQPPCILPTATPLVSP